MGLPEAHREVSQVKKVPGFLTWKDVGEMLGCGRSKALAIVHALGPVYIGRTPLVTVEQIENHLAENGEIRIDWRHMRS